ncbi:family 78 glycoside hydrolase catalytic domain [Hymenobacter sp. BT507]|uniref:alpha-L-rhamnosidase n=1 Tax=Hymenobacter citatus TaxID=2763506 RepID=A0ABR7MFN2_9BACT|nr:alpha-L-rhamnosidase [Hymenobacter citatus]MBC6609861.1 family 78 glycoside hydrolase catalytic domain [Hymenobacter citatus]
MLKTTLAFCLLLLLQTTYASSPAAIVGLQCEYLERPLGLDAPTPRFTWRLQDARPGARQTAYRVLVATDSVALAQGRGAVWNSGVVKAGTTLVTYAGPALQPFTRYYWRVEVKDHRKQPAVSPITSFETGMLDQRNWQGAWIADAHDQHTRSAPYFRKVFEAKNSIKSARAYVAAAGLYELSVNGQRVGNHVLDPMYTRFDRRTLYVTYDITKLLQTGQNALGVLLGNGWYNLQSTAVWDFHKAPWRARPTFCMDVRITYTDGHVETITTGKDWKTALSPVIFNSIYTAEHYDARREQPGWNTVNFNDKEWKEVFFRTAPSRNIVAQAVRPIRAVEELPAQSIRRLNDTTYVFDLGRNIAGVSRLAVQGPAGTVVRLKHGERLYPNGHVDLSNIDEHYRPTDKSDPFQTDIFILGGKGKESFQPRFNYKGFQYVEVTSSRPLPLTKESLTGYFLHSDVPAVGHVASANLTLDKLWQATNASYLSNLFGYPTDCPQREKNGWTGDSHIALETGLYSFDGITVYEKWLADYRDEQQPNGVLPSIVPTNGWGYEWGNGPDWTSSVVLIPWNIYLFYGDPKLLADCYDNMRRYVDHITEISPTHLTTWGLGDWVPVTDKPPVEFTSTCYYYADVAIMAKAARLFGKTADAARYEALAAAIQQAFNAKYLNPQTGLYGKGTQTEMSMPLYWHLVPEAAKAQVAANLAKQVATDNYHLNVGLLGQKAILNALSENGYADVAYRIASQETYPSWGWWIKNGATTLYENWNIQAKHDISLNHIMFGEIGAWLYKGLGGIHPDPAHPGFRNVLLTPHFVPNLAHFEASHEAPQGTIRSAWSRTGRTVHYTVTVPPNATATLHLPVVEGLQAYREGRALKGDAVQLVAGSYTFEWK